jgi:hypothetical protein
MIDSSARSDGERSDVSAASERKLPWRAHFVSQYERTRACRLGGIIILNVIIIYHRIVHLQVGREYCCYQFLLLLYVILLRALQVGREHFCYQF